jgi:protein tyrosine/serine phosphatase
MRYGFITFLSLILLVPSAWAGQVINTPILVSADNFRDLAGIGAVYGGGTADPAGGGYLRPGVVYRSNALTLNRADQTALVKLGIGEDIDLRTPTEIHEQPDKLPSGIIYVNVNIFGGEKLPPLDLSSVAAAHKQMQGIYRGFVTNSAERASFRSALLDVADARRAVVFHCTAGKDRSGWMAILLQSIAGVPQPIILHDYLASNEYRAASIKGSLIKLPADKRPSYAVLMAAQADFLDAAFNAVKRNYGDMQGYLENGLGLTPAQLAALRARLVEN